MMMMKLYTVTCDGADDDVGGGGFSLTRNAVRHTHTHTRNGRVRTSKEKIKKEEAPLLCNDSNTTVTGTQANSHRK